MICSSNKETKMINNEIVLLSQGREKELQGTTVMDFGQHHMICTALKSVKNFEVLTSLWGGLEILHGRVLSRDLKEELVLITRQGNVKQQTIVRNFRSWWYLFSCQQHREFMMEESRERDVSNLNWGWGRTMTMTPLVSELLNILGSLIIEVSWLWASLLTLSSEIITAKRQMGSQPCNVILYSERKIKIQRPGGYSF